MGLVVDTSAIIAWERMMASKQVPLFDKHETLVLPAIVWAEALIGVRMARSAKQAAQRLSRLHAIRSVLGVEPFSSKIAEHYADIYAELSGKGTMIPMNDIAVAATARFLEFAVWVGPNDEKHFKLIEMIGICFLATKELRRGLIFERSGRCSLTRRRTEWRLRAAR